jgi:hypothetical protein
VLKSRDTVTVQTIKVIWNSSFTHSVPSHHIFNIFSDIFVRLPNLHVQNLSILLFHNSITLTFHRTCSCSSQYSHSCIKNLLIHYTLCSSSYYCMFSYTKKNPATFIPLSLLKGMEKKTAL